MDIHLNIHIDDRIVGFFRKVFRRRVVVGTTAAALLTSSVLVYAGVISKPNNFADGTAISASQVNANFDTLFSEVNAKETRMNTLEGASWTKSNSTTLSTSHNISVGGNTAVTGNLAVTGTLFNGGAVTGSLQPSRWDFSVAGQVSKWTAAWGGTITVPKKSVLMVSVNGHWKVDSNWCYLTVLVDGTAVSENNCSSTNSSCWGASHTYSTNWENSAFTGYAMVEAGTRTLQVGLIPGNTTCYLNGSRISYALIPQ